MSKPPLLTAASTNGSSLSDGGESEFFVKKSTAIAKLIGVEGFESFEALAEAEVGDSVSPAICINHDCNFTREMEPDQRRGWCEECRTNTVQSALVLAGLI